ncbi:MAG: exo-beta-N-acetylmuramidase NamZ domain-containing protein [Planctomycetota bacterium]
MNHCHRIVVAIILAALAATAASLRAQTPERVRTGLEVLVAEDYLPLAGAKVGLITNHTGCDRQGRNIVDLFLAQSKFRLVTIFSPEHGFDGILDQSRIDDGKHSSGLTIQSLYGKVRKPTAEMLEGVDTLVFDIQDIGTRFYTYAATLRLCMEAASEHGQRVVVLDRPNPIGGVEVDGPVLAPGDESFIAPHTIAVRHGMTIGELARMFAAERQLTAPLDVITVTGWQRSMLWEDTGLPWINPSPNMRRPDQALLYPGVGLLETTNLSVGRGTDTPFQIVGAPWLDADALWQLLRTRPLRGVAFTPTRFVPTSSKFAGEVCEGLLLTITDRAAVDPLRLGLTLAWAIRRLHPKDFEFAGFARLLAEPEAHAAMASGAWPEQVIAAWQNELAAFRARRETFLLYR